MRRWRQRPFLKLGLPVAGIFALVVACGSDDSPTVLPVSTATAAPATAVVTGATAPPETGPTAIPTAIVGVQTAGVPAGEVELGKAGFVHNDFRTQVATTIDVAESPALGAAQGRTFTVALRNLSSLSGDISSRATINFGSGFQNFVTLQGADGEFKLYLSRNGELGMAPDDSGFR